MCEDKTLDITTKILDKMGTLNFIEKNGICMQNSSMSANKRVTFYANTNRQGRLTGSVLLANFSKCVLFFLCVMVCSCVTPKKFKAYKEHVSTEISSINGKISAIENTNDRQNEEIAGIWNSQTDIKTKLSETEEQLQNLQSQLNSIKDKMSEVQITVNDLEDRLKAIEKYKTEQDFFNRNIESKQLDTDFSVIDEYVLNISYNDRAPEYYSYLVDLLTKNYSTKYEKARAIFIWIANNISYDVTYSIYDADNTFRQRKGVCAGYSALYKKLCTLAGLEVETISGICRDWTYKKGDNIDTKKHAWNAVKDDEGRWFFVDATWGAGYVNNGVFTKEIESYWFDPDPAIYAFTHLPENSEWQKIENPLTRFEFENFPPNITQPWLNGIKRRKIINSSTDR